MTVTLGFVIAVYIVGVMLVLAEVFVPGGITAIVGGILILIALYLAFTRFSPSAGLLLVILTAVILPSGFMAIMKRLRLYDVQDTGDGYTAVDQAMKALVGRKGRTISTLRPAGIAKIEGQRVDVVSFSTMIPPDTPIEVIRVQGNQVVVRPVAETSDPQG